MIRENACPKCHSTVRLEENEDRKPVWKCLTGCNKETGIEEMEVFMKQKAEEEKKAKELAPVPPKPDTAGLNRWGHNQAMHRYYKENKVAILADIQKLGGCKARKRWNIASGTLASLKRAWGLPIAPIRRKKLEAAPSSPKPRQAASVSASDSTKVTKVNETVPKYTKVVGSDPPIPILTLKLIIYVHQNDKVKVVAG